MLKEFLIDCETTGTDPKRHCLHQLAGILQIDGQEVERIDMKICPHPGTEIDEKALAVSGVTKEQIEAYPTFWMRGAYDLSEALRKHGDEKWHIVEWNTNGFDSQFLREFLGGSAMQQFFYSNPINVLSLAGHALRSHRSRLPDFKLGTIAKHFGIEPEGDYHDAMTDVLAMRSIYQKF